MKKLLLLALVVIYPSMHGFCETPAINAAFSNGTLLITQGVSTLLSQAGQVGVSIGSGIGNYIGSSVGPAMGIPFGGEIGSAIGGRLVESAGQQVQHLPQDQRLAVGAGLIAAGYVVIRYGAQIVIGLPPV